MDKKEKIKCLMDAGLNLNESKVLCWLLENRRGVCRRMEHDENLRQPEISVVMGKFEKNGWVVHEDIRKEGKGRPEKEYFIKEEKSIFDSIISDLESKQSKINDMIKKLREEW